MSILYLTLIVCGVFLGLVYGLGQYVDSRRKNVLFQLKGEASIHGEAAHSLSTEKMRIRKSAREKGIIGELGVAQVLAELAEEYGLIVLHDLAMPHSKANIDHVVVSANAVFVIDAKNYSGRVSIQKDKNGTKQLKVGRHKQTQLADKLKSYADAIKLHLVVEGLEIKVIPLLAFYKADFDSNTSFGINGVTINAAGVENEILRYASNKTTTFDLNEVCDAILRGFPHKK